MSRRVKTAIETQNGIEEYNVYDEIVTLIKEILDDPKIISICSTEQY